MITALIIIALMFLYLGYETQWFTVRLESGKNQALQSNSEGVKVEVNSKLSPPISELNKPAEFIPLDMPEFTGKLKIICKRS